MVAIANGSAAGVPPPIVITGGLIRPNYCLIDSSISSTAGRLYYIPIFLPRIDTFAGFKTMNAGVGDNGETYRVGLYDESASGGPGTLVNAAAEVTLTGAAALRTSASSFSNTKIGWHYLAIHHNTAASMYYYDAFRTLSSVGVITTGPVVGSLPEIGLTSFSVQTLKVFPYVDTTYGALASTAVAPTNSTDQVPAVMLYK